jgi:hypothetical protein
MQGQVPVGLLSYQVPDDVDFLRLLAIAVLLPYRRRGMASALVKKGQEEAKALGRCIFANETLGHMGSILQAAGFWVAHELKLTSGPDPIYKWSDKDEQKNNFVPGLDEDEEEPRDSA